MGNLEDKRRETIENLHNLNTQLGKIQSKTKNKKFQEYLSDLIEKVSFTTNNDKAISKKDLKKVFKMLNQINVQLNHSIWNHGKIKRRIKKINKILGIVFYNL